VSNLDIDNVNNMQPFDTGSYASWFAAARPTHWTDFTFFLTAFKLCPSLLFQFCAFFWKFCFDIMC